MKIYLQSPKIPLSAEIVFSRFNADLFKALNPPWMPMKLIRFDGCKTGDYVILKPGIPPFSFTWISKITEHGSGKTGFWFTDEGEKLPFFLKQWKHVHFVANYGTHCVIIDDISFQFSSPVFKVLYPLLYLQFSYRKQAYLRFFGS
jgi:ligand-binding SRPBCC domain-containing protein